jgi:hypothetical protein
MHREALEWLEKGDWEGMGIGDGDEMLTLPSHFGLIKATNPARN